MRAGKLHSTIIIFAVLLVLTGCQSMTNYTQPEGPLFTGTYANAQPEPADEIKIITWNIKFSEKIDTAITELSDVAALQNADIILLQEMDEAGVEAIAQALYYNYVYFPASVHSHHYKNFGNAILSKWPLSDPVKLQLPYENPKNKSCQHTLIEEGLRRAQDYGRQWRVDRRNRSARRVNGEEESLRQPAHEPV